MSRRLSIVAIAFASVLAACGGDDSTPTTQATVSPAAAAGAASTEATDASEAATTQTPVALYVAAMSRPGECFDVEYDAGDFDYTVPPVPVSCDGPHGHEVFFAGTLEGEPGDTYPGDEEVLTRVFDDACIPEFDVRFGPWADTLDLGLWAGHPFAADWDAGARQFFCSVANPLAIDGGDPLIGSVVSGGLTLHGVVLAVAAEYAGRDLYLYPYGEDGSRLPETNLTGDGSDGVEDLAIPSWSPDGSILAFGALDAAGNWDVWVADDSGAKVQINADLPVDSGPEFSPDGTRLLFTSRDRAQQERDIWVMDADGSNMVRLTDDPGVESSAHWSPDGTMIVFRRNAGDGNDIWVMDADGSDQRLLVDLGGDEFHPRWSPLGDQIAFISDVGGDFDVWVVGIDGGEPINLTDHPATDEYPSWSPDGQFVLFNSDRRGTNGLWVMRADGSEQTDLLRTFPVGWAAIRP